MHIFRRRNIYIYTYTLLRCFIIRKNYEKERIFPLIRLALDTFWFQGKVIIYVYFICYLLKPKFTNFDPAEQYLTNNHPEHTRVGL